MSNGNDLKRTHVKFTYLKNMIMGSMKKKLKTGREKNRKKKMRKSASIFFITK